MFTPLYNPVIVSDQPATSGERLLMTLETKAPSLCTAGRHRVETLGVVSFLNARPLCRFLVEDGSLCVTPAVPSRLAAMLEAGECDAALLPVVDYFSRRDALQRISDACIASDGETMTVRVFSTRPAERIERLHVDGDSHTSIVLAQVLWREMYGRALLLDAWRPATAAADRASGAVEAVLLIGDKVVGAAPRGFGFEVDLGAAWKHLTGLPFVFAAWFGDKSRDLSGLAARIEVARDRGVAAAEVIAREDAANHGWPIETAKTYLCDVMRYSLTPRMCKGMERFFEMAQTHGLLA